MFDGCPKPEPELVLTMTPERCRHRCGAVLRTMAKYPLRLTPTVRSHSSSVKRHRSLTRPAVALLMRMSTRPKASSAAPTMSWAPSHVAEPLLAAAAPPAATISATTAAASAPERAPRSLTRTDAPSCARSRACSRPMPPPAPVTIATLPSSRPIAPPDPSWPALTRKEPPLSREVLDLDRAAVPEGAGRGVEDPRRGFTDDLDGGAPGGDEGQPVPRGQDPLRRHEARLHVVEPQLRVLDHELRGDPRERRLRHTIDERPSPVVGAPRRRAVPGPAGDADDGAGPPGGHVAQHRLREDQLGGDVGDDALLDHVGRRVEEQVGAARSDVDRVVEQHVDVAEGGDGLFSCGHEPVAVKQV